jgi:hypothetical protein
MCQRYKTKRGLPDLLKASVNGLTKKGIELTSVTQPLSTSFCISEHTIVTLSLADLLFKHTLSGIDLRTLYTLHAEESSGWSVYLSD